MIRAATVEKLVWVAIYAGMVIGALGLFVQREDDALGWSLVVAGVVSVAVGAVLIVVRSKMNTKETP